MFHAWSNFDDELQVIEIEIVKPPYLLDFGKAHLDKRPDFPEETMAEWEEQLVELFGDDVPQGEGRAAEAHGLRHLLLRREAGEHQASSRRLTSYRQAIVVGTSHSKHRNRQP